MKTFTRGNIARTSLLLAVALSGNSQLAALHGQEQDQHMMLKPWGGPYGGVPPWNLVRPHAFPEAFATAIAQADQEIVAIADQTESPSFANTLVPLETAGRTLERLEVLLGVHTSNLNLGPIPDVERVVSPQLAAFRDRITQNEKLFSRVATIYENRGAATAGRPLQVVRAPWCQAGGGRQSTAFPDQPTSGATLHGFQPELTGR